MPALPLRPTPLTVYLPFNRDCLRGTFVPAKLAEAPPGPRGYWLAVQEQALLVVREGDGFRLTDHTQLWQVPGHTPQDAALVVESDDGVYVMTHLWWHTDRTPEVDPYAPDQALLDANRLRVLAVADIVIPGHGAPFRVERSARA